MGVPGGSFKGPGHQGSGASRRSSAGTQLEYRLWGPLLRPAGRRLPPTSRCSERASHSAPVTKLEVCRCAGLLRVYIKFPARRRTIPTGSAKEQPVTSERSQPPSTASSDPHPGLLTEHELQARPSGVPRQFGPLACCNSVPHSGGTPLWCASS